ncbi:uncharacterized protein [Spinacia oleracea]|uniref:Uncharacterized protein isoform X2 n=1 Tax=Spinacia oleracea TaxID=3562 RepID=A0ABM3RH79_SPIOL|nr:uncharacterized protein LOC130469582 isoform X2 [Spinacia oleracea]
MFPWKRWWMRLPGMKKNMQRLHHHQIPMISFVSSVVHWLFWLQHLNSGSSSSGSSSSDSSSAFRSYKRLSGQSKGTKLTWIPAQCAQQPGSLDCGYYVMRFMYDIIMNHGNSQDLTKDFSRTLPYSPEEINEVKDFWANYFVNNVEFLA